MKRNTGVKIIAAMMALCLALACTACGGNGKDAVGDAPKTSAEAPKESAAAPKESAAEAPKESTAPPPQESAGGDATGGEDYNLDALRTALTEGYMGLTEAGEGAYFASNDDGSFVIVAFYDPATNNSVSFVGPGTASEDGLVTVTDEQNGLALTFSLEAQEDDTILIDMGDIGKALIEPCTVDEIVDALDSISKGSNPLA